MYLSWSKNVQINQTALTFNLLISFKLTILKLLNFKLLSHNYPY